MQIFTNPISEENLFDICSRLEVNDIDEENFSNNKFNAFIFEILKKNENTSAKQSLKILSYVICNNSIDHELNEKILRNVIDFIFHESEEIRFTSIDILQGILLSKSIDYKENSQFIFRFIKNEIFRNDLNFLKKYSNTNSSVLYDSDISEYKKLLVILFENIHKQKNEDLLDFIIVLNNFLINLPDHGELYSKSIIKCGEYIIQMLKDKNIQYSNDALYKVLIIVGTMCKKFNCNWIPSENKLDETFLQNFAVLLTSLTAVIMTISVNESYKLPYPATIEIMVNYLSHINNENNVNEFTDQQSNLLISIINTLKEYKKYLYQNVFEISHDDVNPTVCRWTFVRSFWLISEICGSDMEQFYEILNSSVKCAVCDTEQSSGFFGKIVSTLDEISRDFCFDEFSLILPCLNELAKKLELYICSGDCDESAGVGDYITLLQIFAKYISLATCADSVKLFRDLIINIIKQSPNIKSKSLQTALLCLFLEYFLLEDLDEIVGFSLLVEWMTSAIFQAKTDEKVMMLLSNKMVFPLAKSENLRSLLRKRLLKEKYNGPLLYVLCF